jgi:hypothetical protein
MLTGMRSRRLPLILALACAAAGGTACWSDRPARTTAPDPTGTGGGSATTTAPPPTSGIRFAPRSVNRCARVVAHLIEQSKSELVSSGLPATFLEDLERLAVESCEESEWTPESLDCYERTDNSSDVSTCFGAMTSEQQEDFKRRMFDLQRQHLSAPSPPPPGPPPP